MIKVKDGYGKLIGTTYLGVSDRVLLSNGGDFGLHTGRNNEANKIVRTDANGYILAGWINTTSGNMGTTAINKIYCSNDDYIRYKTPANFFESFDNSGNLVSLTIGSYNRKLTVNYATTSYYLRGGFSSEYTNKWDCNNPDRIVYSDYGSAERNIANAPSGWYYGTLLELGHTSHRGLNSPLNLLLMWDVAHNTSKAGTLWFRGKDDINGWNKNWAKVITDLNIQEYGFWQGTKYWANIPVSNSSSVSTQPTFYNTKILGNNATLYIKNTNSQAESYSIIRFGNHLADNGAYIFLNGPTRTNDGGNNMMTIRNNVGNLRLDNNVSVTRSLDTPKLRIIGTTENPSWNSNGAITWAENSNDAQAVSLVYTSYDTYRAPAGLKLIGSLGNEWLEAPRFIKSGSNDNYILLGGGGHKYAFDFYMTSLIGAKNDYECVIILLFKDAEINNHRINGKIYSTYNGTGRYCCTDLDCWFSRWTSNGYDHSFYVMNHGQHKLDLVTCTYQGAKWWGLKHTNIQAENFYFVGTTKDTSFTIVKYFNTNTNQVLNSEINNSIQNLGNVVRRMYNGDYTIAYTSDLKNPIDYYWANIKISSSPLTNTSPIFANINVNGIYKQLYPTSANGKVVHSILNLNTNPYGLLTRIYTGGAVSLLAQRETTNNEYFNLLLNPLGGNIGIGISSPAYKLHVAGLARLDSRGVNLLIGPQNSSYAHYSTNASVGHWFNKTVEVLGICRPYGNNAYSSGDSSNRWSNVYSYAGDFVNSLTVGGNTVWHGGNGGSGSGLDADLLDGYHASAFQLATFSTKRDFGSGTLITTNINYAVTNGDPFYMEIKGNTYVRNLSCYTLVQGYIWDNTIINYGVTHLGVHAINGLIAMNIGGNLCFWFPRQGYWEGYSIFCASAYNYRVNRVVSITDTGDPGGSKRVNLYKQTAKGIFNTDLSAYLPLAGGQMKSGARIGSSGGPLYIGNADNANWLYLLNVASQSGGADKWYIKVAGNSKFTTTTANLLILGEANDELNRTVDGDVYVGWRRTAAVNIGSGNTGSTTGSLCAKFNNDGLYLKKGWLRTYNNLGWYNETHGGGIYMTDSTWVRTYNNKGIVAKNFYASDWGSSTYLLRSDGGAAAFNWSGQSGLPTWLWGGNNAHLYYVYNPSNFRVSYANSAGSVAWTNVTGRPSSLPANGGTSDYTNRLKVLDVRDATRDPNYFASNAVTAWFNLTGTPDGNWYSGLHIKGWHNGYTSWELCSYSSTGTSNNYRLYHRSGNNTTWGSWKTIAYTSDLTWNNISGKPTIPSISNLVTLNTELTITANKKFNACSITIQTTGYLTAGIYTSRKGGADIGSINFPFDYIFCLNLKVDKITSKIVLLKSLTINYSYKAYVEYEIYQFSHVVVVSGSISSHEGRSGNETKTLTTGLPIPIGSYKHAGIFYSKGGGSELRLVALYVNGEGNLMVVWENVDSITYKPFSFAYLTNDLTKI